MTNKPQKTIIDCSTGTSTVVDLTDEEIAQNEARYTEWLASEQSRIEEQAKKELARASALAKLAALGLTEEEAAALAGI